MKYLYCFLLFISVQAKADCGASGISVFPEQEEIYENSIFTIEGYYFSQEMVKDLDSNYTAYLVSKTEKIKLNILNRYQGMMDLYKVLLKPADPLTLGEVYELKIEDEKGNSSTEVLTRYNSVSKKYEKISWKVSKKADQKVPTWDQEVKHKENTMTMFGCGPANYSIFETSISDQSEILIFAEVKNVKSGKINSYLVPYDKHGMIILGHGMCSGPFTYSSGLSYEVRFKPMDECGNYGPGTLWYSFKNPRDHFRQE